MSAISPVVLIVLAAGWLVLSALALVAFCAIGRAGRWEDEAKGYVPHPRPAPGASTVATVRRLRAG
jgi:hypothetical protein